MKKLLITVAALAIGMSSLFAWTNNIVLGVAGTIPTKVDTNCKELGTLKFNSIGMNMGYLGYADFGLSFLGESTFGFGTAKGGELKKWNSETFGPANFEMTQMLGVGYGVIRTDNMYLGLFGVAGWAIDAGVAWEQEDKEVAIKAAALESFNVGGNITAIYTPTNVFSIYASLTAGVAFGAVEYMDEVVSTKDLDDDFEPKTDKYFADPFFRILPSIGIAWKF